MAAGLSRTWDRFWYDPVPAGRLRVFRTLIYLYLPIDVLVTRWPLWHGWLPASWYAPLWIGRVLHVPAPTRWSMTGALAAMVVLSAITALGRGRRSAGAAIAVLYAYWCYMGFCYGKVDHDRIALLTALIVLPTLPWRGAVEPRKAGWALRCVQMGFMLTYFLAGVTKLLVTGPSWVTSGILVSAITRRGTMFADPLLHVPWLLYAMQLGIVAFELTSPLMMLRNRIGRAFVVMAFGFQLVTYIGITISFRSLLVCIIAFLPLERLTRTAEVVQRAQDAYALDDTGEGHRLGRTRERDEHREASDECAVAERRDGGGAQGGAQEIGAGVAEHPALANVHGQEGDHPPGDGG
jgi:hypothetical protein